MNQTNLLTLLVAFLVGGPSAAAGAAIGLSLPVGLVVAASLLIFFPIAVIIVIAVSAQSLDRHRERKADRANDPLNQLSKVFRKNGWPNNSASYLRWANREPSNHGSD